MVRQDKKHCHERRRRLIDELKSDAIDGELVENKKLSLACNILEKIKSEPSNMKHYTALYSVCKGIGNCSEKWKYTALLKRYCTEQMRKGGVNQKDANAIFRATLLLEARCQRFDSYMQYIELNRDPDKRFWLPRRQQLIMVCDAMQKLIDKEYDLVTISLPPGTGKSTLEIFLHSMMIGAFPDNCSLASGHSSTLTKSIYNGVLEIIQDPDYLWSEIYGDKNIITNAEQQTIDIGKKHRFSSLTCRSIDGSLTGATRCEKILTADDLVSGYEEALSRTRMDKLWDIYNNNLKTRKKNGCPELHLATRWSVHDPIGRLFTKYSDSDRAMFIVMPALDENGESNFNYKYGVGFDTAYFNDMRENLDDCSFRALYMNEPIEREGQLYNEDELRRYFELPPGEPDAILSVCDTKDKGSDFCVMPIVYQYGNDFYVEDILCDNSAPEIVEARLVELLLKHKVKMSRFESNSAGGKIAEKVQKGVKERGGITTIQTKFSTANKETRIIVDSPFVKERFLFKDDSILKKLSAQEYIKAIGMLCSYTMTGRNPHDDVPDAFSMMADFIQSFEGSMVKIGTRPY